MYVKLEWPNADRNSCISVVCWRKPAELGAFLSHAAVLPIQCQVNADPLYLLQAVHVQVFSIFAELSSAIPQVGNESDIAVLTR